MQSSKSKAIEWLLRLSGVKALTEWTDGDILSWIIEKDLLWEAEAPRWLTIQHETIEVKEEERRFFHFPSSQPQENQDYIFYVHGGGFLMEIYFLYWLFIHRLLNATHADLMVPIYPLIPRADFDSAYRALRMTYEQWYEKIPEHGRIHIIADSSGGAMGLRLAQEWVAEGHEPVDNLILVSPWLNLDVKEKELEQYAEIDPFISVTALKHCARLAVPSEDYKNPRYSPINGNLKGIGRISVFTGTGDTLYPDSKELREKAAEENVELNYYEHQNMFHIYPHFPVEEGIQAFQKILEIIQNKEVEECFTIIKE